MRSLKKLSVLLMILLTVRVELAFPQASVSSSELRGQITDQNGAAVAGATITLTDVSKGTTRTTTTDGDGNYVFLVLPPGTYNMKVEAQGFGTKNLTNVHLDVGQVGSVPVQLSVGGVQAEIDITAEGQVVEVERTQQSTVINERMIENLPINRRNYLDFALLTPGVTDSDNVLDSSDFRVAQTPQSGLSFGGNNGRGNSIMVDGASADTNSGGARDVVGQEAVQEFQVNRNSYNAEFGGASGGIVNIISKTGSNDFHGSLFGYFRNERFDARNAFDFAPKQSPFDRQQFGGSLGGRIRPDKTFFFTSLERLDQTQTTFINLLTNPAIFGLTASQQSLFNFLSGTPFAPVAAGLSGALTTTEARYPRTLALFRNNSGEFPFESSGTVFSARVDNTFGEKDSGYLRFNLADSSFENQAAGALNAFSRGRTADAFTGGLLASYTHLFGPTTVNELKAQYSYLDSDFIPNDLVGPEINIEGAGNFGRDIFLPSEAIERRYEISDNVGMVMGAHTLKFGGQLQFSDNSNNSQTFFGGRFNFGTAIPLSNIIALNPALGPAVLGQITAFLTANNASLLPALAAPITAVQSFNLNLPIVYQQGFGESGFNAWVRRYSFYGQDTWKVRPNFTLNLGARYFLEDWQMFGESDRNNIQPRVAFSWDPWGDGKTAIRGGFGMFVGPVDIQIVNVVNELGGFGTPSDINIVLATATSGALGLPTSFAVYQRLLAQGVIGTRTITAADLAQFNVTPRPGAPLEVRFRREPNYENPYTLQGSFAVQRDLGAGFSTEVSYLYARGAHLTRNRDINQFKRTGPVNPLNPEGGPTFIRFPTAAQVAAGLTSDFRNPLRLQDNVYESSANSFYHAGTIQVIKRFSNNFALNANYTLSKTIDEVTDFNSDWSAQNPLDVRLDRALSAFDQRHRLVMSGVFEGPRAGDSPASKVYGNWVFSPIFIAGSGRPFNVLLGFDANADGRSQSDRPGQAARNTGRGEPYYNLDARLARRFFVGEGKYIELTFEGFNVLNRVNYIGVNNVVGCNPIAQLGGSFCAVAGVPRITDYNVQGIKGLTPTSPLGFTAAAPARQLQFGARFNF